MRFIRSGDFTAANPWDAIDITSLSDATVRLHWTDKPYKWHINDGREVFVVMDGEVEMRYREKGIEKNQHMVSGDICFAEIGDEHVAHPIGEARILVIEKRGSV